MDWNMGWLLLVIGISIVLIVGSIWFVVSQYKKDLEWVRDRLDLSVPENVEILKYINGRLDSLNGYRGIKKSSRN